MAVIAVFFGVFWMCGIPPRDVPDWIQSVARPRFYGRMKELRHESLLTAGKLLETSSPTAAGVIKALDSKLSGGDASPDGPVDAVVSIGGEEPADPSGFDQIPPEMSDEYRSYEQIAREAERRAREREAAAVEYRRNETAWNDVIKQIPSTAEVEDRRGGLFRRCSAKPEEKPSVARRKGQNTAVWREKRIWDACSRIIRWRTNFKLFPGPTTASTGRSPGISRRNPICFRLSRRTGSPASF